MTRACARWSLGLALLCASLILVPGPTAAAVPHLDHDGWYRWSVPAGAGGSDACCYRWHRGAAGVAGCRLGDGGDPPAVGDCDFTSDTLDVYVEIRVGRVNEIHALSSTCPVSMPTPVTTIDGVDTDDSVAWLVRQLTASPRLVDEAILAVSLHEDRRALQALVSLLEDRQRSDEVREQALFWLVQSESDDAYAYLDRLLSPQP